MARGKRKTKQENAFGVVLDLVEAADTIFAQLTGKSIATWFKEFQQQPRQLPEGDQIALQQEPTMALADAYMVLGLPQTATLEEVKGNYRRLAAVFHPDRKGGYKEAMVLLNQAYDRIRKEKGK